MKKCPNCGSELSDDAQFCNGCGARMEAPASGTAQRPSAQSPQGISKEDYRSAKESYKQARKAAGKSRKPLVIVVIVAIVLLVVATAAATWYLMGTGQPEAVESGSAASSSSSSSSSSASSPLVESDGSSSVEAGYLGTWKGSLTSTKEGTYKRCYGAEGSEMTLDIEDITSTGRVKASCEVMYHGHEAIRDADVETASGDSVLKLSNLTSTFSDKGFGFEVKAGSEDDDRLEIEIARDKADDVLKVTVRSVYDGNIIETDTYTLKKS